MTKLARRLLFIGVPLALAMCGGAWIYAHWLGQATEIKPYSLIEEGLYVGRSVAAPPPGTTAVLNLCEIEDSYQAEEHRWEPISGAEKPDLEWLARMVAFIDTQRAAGRTTYVHCQIGVNRSGAVAVAYLMHEHGWTRAKALAFAQAKRPEINPNSVLLEMLVEWETELRTVREQTRQGTD